VEEIDKLRIAYQKISGGSTKKVAFKLPKLLHLSMQDVINEGKAETLSGYYVELVAFPFYCLYQSYFEEVLAGNKAIKNTLIFDHLPSCGLSQHDLKKVKNYQYHASQISIRKFPGILVEVCAYIQASLDFSNKRNDFIRDLTMPIAILALKDRIDQKIMRLESGQMTDIKTTKNVGTQLSITKWSK